MRARLLMVLIVSAVSAGLLGCSPSGASACRRGPAGPAEGPPVAVLPEPMLQASDPPSLLFDRVPGRYSAEGFAYRSDWPATNAYYAPGEVIYYHERFMDYQGPGRPSWHGTYRRFSTYRTGVGYR